MPSTVVHVAFAALLAAALLRDAYGTRAVAIVLAVTIVPDLDTFVGVVLPGTHRAALHTLLVPIAAAALLYYDTRVRNDSIVRGRSPHAARIAWVSVAAYVLAGIGPDLFTNGVNLFYPIHDRFYTFSGHVYLSNDRGLIQTLWEPAKSVGGTTADTHYYTGVDPTRGSDRNVERLFPIASNGRQVLLILVAVAVTAFRLWEDDAKPSDGVASPDR